MSTQLAVAREVLAKAGATAADVAAIVKAVGYRKGIAALKNVSTQIYTGNMRDALKAAGFTVLTDPKYLSSDAYLLAGDILLNDSAHVCTNLTNGAKSGSESVTAAKPETVVEVSGLPLVQKGDSGAVVVSLQALLNAKNNAGLEVDGEAGSLTDTAIRDYQSAKGLDVDGQCGKATWSRILTT